MKYIVMNSKIYSKCRNCITVSSVAFLHSDDGIIDLEFCSSHDPIFPKMQRNVWFASIVWKYLQFIHLYPLINFLLSVLVAVLNIVFQSEQQLKWHLIHMQKKQDLSILFLWGMPCCKILLFMYCTPGVIPSKVKEELRNFMIEINCPLGEYKNK